MERLADMRPTLAGVDKVSINNLIGSALRIAAFNTLTFHNKAEAA